MDYLNQFEKYKAHYEEWCKFDLMNIGDRAMQAVHEKQWAVARLHDSKRDRDKLIRDKNNLKEKIIKQISEKSPVVIDKKTLDKIDSSPQLESLNQQIKDCEFLVKYLEDIVKMFTYIAQDIKNCIDSIKLEQL